MIKKQIAKYRPCGEAVEWLGERRSVERAWRECERADWMLWIADKIGVDRKKIVLAACDCAETSLVHVPNRENGPRLAIRAARDWAVGGSTTIEQVKSAAYASDAYAATAATYAAYAASAATYAATYAAYASAPTASAAYAAYAAAAVAYFAAASAAYAAYAASASSPAARHRKMCDLVRNHISAADVAAAMGEE